MLDLTLTAAYGALLSLMNQCNARLSGVYGNWAATVMIHAVGLLVLLPFAFGWGRPRGRAPWYQYTGGLIGILSVVFVNVGVAGVGVTGNLVLMLLGQISCSAAVDHFGLLGAKRSPMTGRKLASIALMAAGCGAMLLLSGEGLDGASALAAALSFLSGCTMIFARMANAALSLRAGVGFSTVMNYVTGLGGSLLVLACLGLGSAGGFLLGGGGALTPRLPGRRSGSGSIWAARWGRWASSCAMWLRPGFRRCGCPWWCSWANCSWGFCSTA